MGDRMSKVRIYGDTSGYIDVAAPATADNSTLDLSTVAKTTGNQTFGGSVTVNSTTSPQLVLNRDSVGGDGMLKFQTAGTDIADLVARGNGDLWLRTNQTQRLVIDGSGRVTMPYQPRFSAYWHDGAALRASPATMKFNDVDVNVGNHYNSSTYLFTAPIAGDYFFMFSVNSRGTGQFYNYFIKNGTQIPAGQSYTDDNATYKMGNSSLIITLQANDTMGVYLHNGSDYQNSYQNTFCGYLIG